MSKKVNVWLAEKIHNAESKVEATKDLQERIQILSDYNLILLGASEILEVSGDAEGSGAVNNASEVVNSMLDTLEKRVKLEESFK